MKRTRKRPPYREQGGRYKFNFPAMVPGVYLIYPEGSEKPVYIGHGGKVARALYRHFQRWDDDKQVRVTYPKTGYTVRVVYVPNKAKAERIERALILKHRPKDNPNKLSQLEFTDRDADIATAAENAPFMPAAELAPF